MERLCARDLADVRKNLEGALAEAVALGRGKRDPIWTESLAVGSAGYLEKIKPLILLARRETEIDEAAGGLSVWREPCTPYEGEKVLKNEPKTEN